jgi:hypothetical protein
MRNFKVDGKLHFQNILKEYSETNEQRLTLLEHLHIFYHDLTQFNHDILEQVISKIIEKKLYSLIVKDTRQARYDRGLGSKPKYHKLTKEQKEELLKNMTHDTDARINIQKEVLEKHAKAMSQVVHFTSQYYEKTYSKSEIDFAFLYSRDIVKKRYISDDEDFGNDQFCEACQNSPCICSDPRTSTIDDINITN